jgi:hypothetical protein
METQCGRKPWNDFLICQNKCIHRKNQLPCFPATTGRRLQPPSFSGSNLKEATTPLVFRNQLEGDYNPLSLLHPTALKYKCQNIDISIVTLSLSICPCKTCHNLYKQPVRIISSTNQICHSYCHNLSLLLYFINSTQTLMSQTLIPTSTRKSSKSDNH